MAYIVKARYYAEKDNFGETFILQSDNGQADLKLEVGTKVTLVPREQESKKNKRIIENE